MTAKQKLTTFRDLLDRDPRTVEDIAKACNCSRSFLFHLAAGTRYAQLGSITSIAKGLKLSVAAVTRALWASAGRSRSCRTYLDVLAVAG